jgi:hypothetical protein
MNYIQTLIFQKYEHQTFHFFLEKEFTIPKNNKKRPLHLLIIHSGKFQPLHIDFIHLIKKLQLHIHLFTDISNIPSLQQEIMGDELENYIHFYHGNPFLIETFKNQIFDMI